MCIYIYIHIFTHYLRRLVFWTINGLVGKDILFQTMVTMVTSHWSLLHTIFRSFVGCFPSSESRKPIYGYHGTWWQQSKRLELKSRSIATGKDNLLASNHNILQDEQVASVEGSDHSRSKCSMSLRLTRGTWTNCASCALLAPEDRTEQSSNLKPSSEPPVDFRTRWTNWTNQSMSSAFVWGWFVAGKFKQVPEFALAACLGSWVKKTRRGEFLMLIFWKDMEGIFFGPLGLWF